MDSELLTLARVARRLGVPARWLRDEADAGRVPCLRAGARYLFDLRALTECLGRRAGQELRRQSQEVTDAR